VGDSGWVGHVGNDRVEREWYEDDKVRAIDYPGEIIY
jgi:hypothetical protein